MLGHDATIVTVPKLPRLAAVTVLPERRTSDEPVEM
jgi:hypothetical protein